MKTYLQLITSCLCVLAAPMLVSAADEYGPRDVEHIFIDEQGDTQTYDVLVMLESGRLYRLDTVTYDDTRYQLYEDISDLINDHRDFRSFDDEDIADLIWGIAPFNVSEITNIETEFSEEEVDVILSFNTGDTAWYSRELGEQRFSSSVEVTQFLVDIINSTEELEGEITTAEVVTLHEEPYTGLSYFAPELEGVVARYEDDDEAFLVEVRFANEEVRSFQLEYKDTKAQLIQDITLTINELYVEYEDARFDSDEVESVITWQSVPWMIDDIESITASKDVAMDGTIEFTVRSRLSSGLVGVITLNKVYKSDQYNIESLALKATEALEENELFAHDFNVSLVQEIIVDSIPEEDRELYGLDGGGSSEADEDESQEDESAASEEDEEEESSQEEDEDESEADESTDEYSSLSEQEIIDLLTALIIQYVLANGMDVDLSALTS